jgi:hypothetical protein
MRTILRLILPAAALALAAAAPGNAAAQQRIRCESRDYDREYCSADTRGGVQLVRQLSRSACSQGRTWGATNRGIWVSNGCRGEFYVGASYGRNDSYGSNEPWYGRKDDNGRDGRYGRNGRDDGRYGRGDDRYGRDGRNVSERDAANRCRSEVQRHTRGSRDDRVRVGGAAWDSRRDAYLVRWSVDSERGSCEVRGRDGRVRIYRDDSRW